MLALSRKVKQVGNKLAFFGLSIFLACAALSTINISKANAYFNNNNLSVSLDYQGMQQSNYSPATINVTITYNPSNQDLYHTLAFVPIISKYAPNPPNYEFGWANDADGLMTPMARYVSNLNPIVMTFFYHPLITQGWNYIGCVGGDDTSYTAFCSNSAQVNYTGSVLPVYRFWNKNTNDHFYTYDHDEKVNIDTNLGSSGWGYEEIAYHAFISGDSSCSAGSPVYRFWSQNTQQHFYTIDYNEASFIANHYPSNEWSYEGVAYCQPMYVNNTCGNYLPVYRYWNSSTRVHFFTTSNQERDQLAASSSWTNEGIAFCAIP